MASSLPSICVPAKESRAVFDRDLFKKTFGRNFSPALSLAFTYAKEQAGCRKHPVAAIIYQPDLELYVFGWNGPGAFYGGHSRCERPADAVSGTLMDLCTGLHAERRGISVAAKEGIPLKNSVLYMEWAPCFPCAQMIAESGIVTLVSSNLSFPAGNEYQFPRAERVLLDAGVSLVKRAF